MTGFCHATEVGRYFVDNVELSDFGQDARNYAMIQDRRGRMYFANNHSVYMYDGVHWQVLEQTIGIEPRSFALAKDGRIFVGCAGGMGWLDANQAGLPGYTPLQDKLAEETVVGNVWDTVARPEGVYFRTSATIYFWDNQRLSAILPQSSTFHRMFEVDNQLVVQLRRQGLLTLRDGQLSTLVNGEFFKDKTIYDIIARGDHWLLTTSGGRVFQFADGRFTPYPWPEQTLQLLAAHRLYRSILLADNTVAIAVTGPSQGLLLVDDSGQVAASYSGQSGLSDDLINYLYQDSDGGLWVGAENGIDRLDLGALSYFGSESGVQGYINFVQRHEGRLYVTTSQGIFLLEQSGYQFVFKPLLAKGEICGRMFSTAEGLVVLCSAGLYRVDVNQAQQVMKSQSNLIAMARFDDTPQTDWLVVLSDGLGRLFYRDGGWQYLSLSDVSIPLNGNDIAVDSRGFAWIENGRSGVLSIEMNEARTRVVKITVHTEADGLPKGGVFPSRVAGEVVFNTDVGLFDYDAQTGRFEQTRRLGDFVGRNVHLNQFIDDSVAAKINLPRAANGALRTQVSVARRGSDGKFEWQDKAFERLDMYPATAIYSEQNGVSWVKSGEHLLRFDSRMVEPQRNIARPFVRKVSGTHSVDLLALTMKTRRLDYRDNSLRFEFGFPAFDAASQNRFQYFLEGFDSDWSEWSHESHRDYTKIAEGDYRFRLRARNVDGDVSEAAPLAFTILPPWYRTWWAFLLYIAVLLLVMVVVMQLRTKALRQRAQKLESIIEERTKTIREGAEVIEQQKTAIEQLLAQKNDLFANISHEFRTPLTLMLGPAASLLKGNLDENQRSQVGLIRQSGFRLLRMVNQILSLAKLSAIPYQERVDLSLKEHMEFMVASFQPLAAEKQINLVVPPFDEARLTMVSDALEKILINLLSNAIKYTPAEGTVSLFVDPFKEGWVALSVADTGFRYP